MQKKTVRVIAVILAIILACSVFVGALATVANAATLDELKAKEKELDQKLQEAQAQIDDAESKQADIIKQKETLDKQIIAIQDLIDNITEQIVEYDGLIADKQLEVEAAQAKEDEQYELYKSRIRTMEENGTISYFEIIFGAKSFTDLLSRIELISEIMAYDESVYEAYVVAKQETIEAMNALEEANELQKAAKAEQEERQAELLEEVEKANKLINDLENNLETYKKTYDELEAEENRVHEEMSALIAAQTPSGGNTGNGDGIAHGSLKWPVPSSRNVTSPFGMRWHPVYGSYKMHNGIDIGASYGKDVIAADGGTVVTAKYSSSYGYYIVINHGNGMKTTYAHLSKLLVSAGQEVSQGQLIGLIGSTGISTGPHLHYEVAINGTRVNPMNYY